MSRSRCVLPLAAVALIGGLTACGGGSSKSATDVAAAISSAVSGAAATASPGDGKASATPTDTSSSVSVSTSAPSTPAGGGSDVRPDSDESKTLVYLLEAIDPGMGTDANGLIGKSVTVCQHILGGDSGSMVNALIQQQFANGSYVPQGEQLTAIDLALTQIFCR